MWKLYAAIAIIWAALMPPFFTDGACNREFEKVSAHLSANPREYRTPEKAVAYWTGQGVSPSVITNDSCREVRPRFLDRCPQGTLVHAAVPVDNLVCRTYRDDAVRVQMLYGEKKNLLKVGADMKPDKYLWIPLIDTRLYWGR